MPGVRQSGDHVWQGHVTRQGNRYIRWGMVEAAQVAPSQDPALHALYGPLKHRRGPKKARVAVWHVLTYQQEYRHNSLTKHQCPGEPESVSGQAQAATKNGKPGLGR